MTAAEATKEIVEGVPSQFSLTYKKLEIALKSMANIVKHSYQEIVSNIYQVHEKSKALSILQMVDNPTDWGNELINLIEAPSSSYMHLV